MDPILLSLFILAIIGTLTAIASFLFTVMEKYKNDDRSVRHGHKIKYVLDGEKYKPSQLKPEFETDEGLLHLGNLVGLIYSDKSFELYHVNKNGGELIKSSHSHYTVNQNDHTHMDLIVLDSNPTQSLRVVSYAETQMYERLLSSAKKLISTHNSIETQVTNTNFSYLYNGKVYPAQLTKCFVNLEHELNKIGNVSNNGPPLYTKDANVVAKSASFCQNDYPGWTNWREAARGWQKVELNLICELHQDKDGSYTLFADGKQATVEDLRKLVSSEGDVPKNTTNRHLTIEFLFTD